MSTYWLSFFNRENSFIHSQYNHVEDISHWSSNRFELPRRWTDSNKCKYSFIFSFY